MGMAWPGLVISMLLLSGARAGWSQEASPPEGKAHEENSHEESSHKEAYQEESREPPMNRRAGIWGVTLGTVWGLGPGGGGLGEAIRMAIPELRPRMHYYFSPRLAMEGEVHIGGDWQQNAFSLANGAGLLDGSEIGMGLRLLLLRSRWSPALGGGTYLYAGGRESQIRSRDWTVTMQAGPTAFGWLYGGLDYLGPRGFTFAGQVGYKHLLTPHTIRIETTGRPNPSPESFRKAIYSLGFHLSLSFGKSFSF